MHMHNKPLEIAWIKKSVFESIVNGAQHSYPCETGGCLAGYWANPLNEIVITDIIGPGPKAKHSKDEFQQDHEWQTIEIEKIYRESNNLHTYLGDWHSHPDRPRSGLSWKDIRTLRRIGAYGPARITTPIMAIAVGGSPWKLRIWYLIRRSISIFPFYKVKELELIKIY